MDSFCAFYIYVSFGSITGIIGTVFSWSMQCFTTSIIEYEGGNNGRDVVRIACECLRVSIGVMIVRSKAVHK